LHAFRPASKGGVRATSSQAGRASLPRAAPTA
jgi:hypothetical protein